MDIITNTDALYEILSYLPKSVLSEITRTAMGYRHFYRHLGEIRLRRNRVSSLTVDGVNLILTSVLTPAEMDATFRSVCRDSAYAYRDSLANGYVPLPGGGRAGVVGRASVGDDGILAVTNIESIVFRIPHDVPGMGQPLYDAYFEGHRNIIVYSPPGIGKTTLLRDTAKLLASGADAKRVAIVDCREEFAFDDTAAYSLIDLLSSYPKAKGMEIALRTLSPEVLICDEIGNLDESAAVKAAYGTGVSVILSAHADNLKNLKSRPFLRPLFDSRMFSVAFRLSRENGAVVITKENLSEYTSA